MDNKSDVNITNEVLSSASKIKEQLLSDMLSEQSLLLSSSQLRAAETAILPRIAWYKALKNSGVSEDEALAFVWDSLIQTSKAKKRFASFCGYIPGGFFVFRKIFYKALQADLWDNKFTQNDANGLCFNTTRCLYKDLAVFYNCLEIVPLFCKIDHVLFDGLKHIQFNRTQTLGNGGTMCDFHYFAR